MAIGATSTVAAVALLVAAGAVATAAAAARTASPAPFTAVWDAYPAGIVPVCPHIPRRGIDIEKLNGRWYVIEKGGHSHPETLCEMNFQIQRRHNLTLRVELRAFETGNLVKQYNSTWQMSEDHVWRNTVESQFMFLGHSTNRALLVICVVDAIGDSPDGYSLALSRETSVRQGDLSLARYRGYVVEATDRVHCPRD